MKATPIKCGLCDRPAVDLPASATPKIFSILFDNHTFKATANVQIHLGSRTAKVPYLDPDVVRAQNWLREGKPPTAEERAAWPAIETDLPNLYACPHCQPAKLEELGLKANYSFVQALPFHKASYRSRCLTRSELNALAASIRKNGLRVSIKLLDGQLLDGRHRLKACSMAGVEPTFEELDGVADPAAYVDDLNEGRRQNSSDQRTLSAARLYLSFKEPQAGLAERAGISRQWLNKVIGLLKVCPMPVEDALHAGRLGIKDVARAAKIARRRFPDVEAALTEAFEYMNDQGIGSLYGALDLSHRRQLAGNQPPLPAGKYRTVVIDPPWRVCQDNKGTGRMQNSPDYPLMDLAEITGLDVPGVLAEEAFVFLWTTHDFLPQAFDVLKAWGLEYFNTTMVWHKTDGGYQPTGHPQRNCEFVLIARKGDAKLAEFKELPALFAGKRTRHPDGDVVHSAKPDEFYDLIRPKTLEPRLDMFGRAGRPGFEVWGNQAAEPASAPEAATDAPTSAHPADPPVKRKRGRPRKTAA